MLRRFVLSALCVLGFCSLSSAAADPQSKERYELKVVLHVEYHRLLTEVFVDRLQRELSDWLQEAVGELAHVQIVKPEAAVAAAMEKGLSTLDPVRDPTMPKTHFVLIRYVKGQYEIQARQFDGMTGLWSPVRTDHTRAPDVVSKMATTLVYRDFGVVGTVVTRSINDKNPVKVELKGGGLGVPMNRWVKEKEVFALVPIQADGTPGTREPWALLRVTEAPAEGSGTCICMLYHRHPLRSEPPQGYRCLKLGTTVGPLKIRISQRGEEGGALPLTESIDVGVSPNGFQESTSPVKGIARAETGVFDSSTKGGSYEHVAFVRIKTTPEALVPVEILDDDYVDILVNVTKEEGLILTLERDDWRRGIDRLKQMQANKFVELTQMATKAESRTEALESAKRYLDRLRNEVSDSRKRGNEIGKKLREAKRPVDFDSDFKRLTEIEKSSAEVIKFIDSLQEIERQENSPERKRWLQMLKDGEIAEEAADIGTAISIYEKLLMKEPDPFDKELFAKLGQKTKKLKDWWEPKSPAHSNAREFLTKTFPGLTPAEVKAQTREIKDAVEELKRSEDRFFLPKFIQEIDTYGQKMKDKKESLKPNESPEDREQLGLLIDVAKLLNEIRKDADQANDALMKKK